MIKKDTNRLLEILKTRIFILVVLILNPNILELFDLGTTLITSEHFFLQHAAPFPLLSLDSRQKNIIFLCHDCNICNRVNSTVSFLYSIAGLFFQVLIPQ